jgi:hypothetical protein
MSAPKTVGHRILASIAVFFLLLALYFLSLGPLVRLRLGGVLPASADNVLEAFYQPLNQLGNRFKAFERFTERYIMLWNPNHPDLTEN